MLRVIGSVLLVTLVAGGQAAELNRFHFDLMLAIG
jgi:hypothetical protein